MMANGVDVDNDNDDRLQLLAASRVADTAALWDMVSLVVVKGGPHLS